MVLLPSSPALAQGERTAAVERSQQGSGASLRVVEQSASSVTFEVRARWSGRLVEQAGPALSQTLFETVGGLPFLSRRIDLRSLAEPVVTVLSADYDEVPLTFSPEELDEAGLSGSPAAVERIGMERRSPTGTFVARVLHADVEAGTLRRYRRMLVRVDFPAQRSEPRSDAENPHLGVTQSVLASGRWYRIPVTREGVVRIDRAFISNLGLDPNTIDPARVRVYGNGGAPVPELNSAPRIPDLAENARLVIGGGDGRFSDGDAVIFFAYGASGWTWNSALTSVPRWEHFINPYSSANQYFIRVDGEPGGEIQTAPAVSGSATALERVQGRLFVEDDLPDGMINRDGGGSGMDWLGRDVTSARPRLAVLDSLPDGLVSGPVHYRTRAAARNTQTSTIRFRRGETVLSQSSVGSTTGNVVFQPTVQYPEDQATAGQRLRLEMELVAGGSPTGWIDYVQAFYTQDLTAREDYLRWASPGDRSGPLEFVLRGFSTQPEVWDVTSPDAVRRLPVTASGGSFRARIDAELNAPRELVAFVPGSPRIRRLNGARAESVPNQNLHGIPVHPDYLIITAEPFMAAAEDLAAYRAAQGLTPLVVDIREIYNEFSGGLLDPRGMRDFIRFVYDRAPGPEPTLRNVLLFGDGNYDYRGIRNGGVPLNQFIPTFQTENSNNVVQSYTSDDYFVLLDPDEGTWNTTQERIDAGIGRLPVRTAQEAAEMVAKIKRYEDPATHGPWRTRYTVLADDHLPNSWDTDLHIQNAELVADSVQARVPGMNIEKIHMPMYPLQQTALGARYPEATAAAIRSLEEGTLVWNYAGHGSYVRLADESLITREQIGALTNFDRLTIGITATCSFGRYDLPDERSGGELFVLNPAGGAIAMFTTVRVVYTGTSPTGQNLGMNVSLNRELLSPEADGRPVRLGDAYFRAKAEGVGASTNSRRFNLLGDPALQIGLPQQPVRVSRVNGIDITETTTPPSASSARAEAPSDLPELRALELATIEGEVLRADGSTDAGYNGEVEVLVYDVERRRTLPQIVPRVHTDGTFRERTDLIYRGRASVTDGRWQAQFIVPRDVSYAGEPARVSAYVTGSSGRDGQGFSEQVRVATTAGAPLDDAEGPQIRLFINDTTFVAGSLTGSEPVLIAQLSDESGINVAGAGVGHEMLLTLNGNEAEAVNVASFYRSDLDTFRSGTLRYPLGDLPPGHHTLTLTAWDVANNPSTASLDFVVAESDRLVIEHVYPYPNPTTGPTRFVFEHNQTAGTPARVQVRIFSISGRPIRTLDGAETLPDGVLTGQTIQIPWDGRDEDFDPLATGVYLYHVRVEVDAPDGERRVAERVERLVIIR